ncbi:MAG TPA: flagellar basal-body MS-ring/collar protein FliF [Fibrobacteraceae bacterium]|nr:flagellar basal-body MS-ring/collar protein FliF [Fibrobacteraceae bacterium]
MSEFFKQLLTQLRDIWVRFNTLQKALIIAIFVITFIGLVAVISIQGFSGKDSGQATLFANLELNDAAEITAFLKENKFKYDLDNDGRTVLVPKESVYEVRMSLARAGLPREQGKGYELFDKNQLGMTDFTQNLNYRRAVETELMRSIETFREVETARVHINIPKETIFLEKKEEATASVIIRLRPGQDLQERQIKGIQHLVSSAVEGLRARQVTVLDDHGNMLTRGFADNAIAEATDHNMELKHSVESYVESQVMTILDGVLGPNKARVKVSADLDFDQISRTVETYDPSKKVVRSEQRDDGTKTNSPIVGNETKEGSITNYEINRTVSQIASSPGNTKRLTVSVAVDGSYEKGADGKEIYKPRSPDEIQVLTQLVRNAVGYSAERNDDVYVASVQFDRSAFIEDVQSLGKVEGRDIYEAWAMRGMIVLIILLAFVFLRKIAVGMIEAMNPPLPKFAGINLVDEKEEVPERIKRHNELLQKLEEYTISNPVVVSDLLRSWLLQGAPEEKKGNRNGK